MEIIKSIIKQFYPLIISGSCVLFVIWAFFSASIYSGKGVFEGGGNLLAPMLDGAEIKIDGLSYVESMGEGEVPFIKYVGGVRTAGECVVFKDLLQVQKSDGSFVSGSTEDGYTVYLMDIKTMDGNRVLAVLSSGEIAELEEIPASFVYNKENDLLYFHGDGIYNVQIKIYGNSGGQTTYEFQLPVEPM